MQNETEARAGEREEGRAGSGMEYTPEMMNRIYEAVLNQVEEAVVISDDENKVIFINRAAEVIEGVDAKKSLHKSMEELYCPTENTPKHSRHAIVLNTGIAANEYFNQYVVKESHKVLNVIERMFPVNYKNRTVAVYSLIKNLPVMKKTMEQSLELYTHFEEEKPRNGTKYTFSSILGNDINFVEAISNAKHVAQNQTNVLIYGETGTGKELFAQSIHNYSVFQNGPFISVNCAAIPATLLESMFFGTVKGSYTGANNMAGLFEQAENGTLFLDEINSMDIALQAKLLKVIENKTVRRIGSEKELAINCRILCALNEDPLECIENGKLRRDLYYRLSSCILHIPPLRSRKSDIPLLCGCFITRFNREYGQHIRRIDSGLMERFLRYQWPGNVRELQHVVESAYSVSEQNLDVLRLEHISPYYRSFFAEPGAAGAAAPVAAGTAGTAEPGPTGSAAPVAAGTAGTAGPGAAGAAAAPIAAGTVEAAASMAAAPAASQPVDSPISSAAGSTDPMDFPTTFPAVQGDFRALPGEPTAHRPSGFPGSPGQSPELPPIPLKEAMDAYEKSILAATLARLGGNVSAAARELMITRQALQHKIKKYGL
ncbi:sigma 54-interacting transcriptional regulator [Enterocloster lavalensis]|uniref:sigma-54 interaction domain-containing protein n=1 Tax=Enterocloster lavalensis TaxID=460384 RepID=UPI001D0653A5|nr:sigma 54-interacting transcriptional regulator [Enterocloster lavalensis]